MSGYEICRPVRGGDGINDPWDPDLPITMLSAKAEHVDRVRGLQGGAVDRDGCRPLWAGELERLEPLAAPRRPDSSTPTSRGTKTSS